MVYIKNHDLVFWNEIGWVDMGHAKPYGSTELLERINKLYKLKDIRKELTYLQTQNKLGYKMQAGLKFEFQNISSPSKDAYFVFYSVSNYFETKQEKNILLHSRLRSLGDMNGNIISFWCSKYNISEDDFFSNMSKPSRFKTALLLVKSWITLEKDRSTIIYKKHSSLNDLQDFHRQAMTKISGIVIQEIYKVELFGYKIKQITKAKLH